MADQSMVSSIKPAGPSEKVRNWLDLPVGVMHRIFLKVGAIDIIFSAQAVCTEWRNISKEPLLFHYIDMRLSTTTLFKKYAFSRRNKICKPDLVETAKIAVDRSCGQMVEFTMGDFGTDELLAYIADRSDSLKLLRLVSCNKVSARGLTNISNKVPMLEKLEIVHCYFLAQTLEAIVESFPRMKSFMLVSHFDDIIDDDFDAEVISKNMPELRHLCLRGNQLTSLGLYSIILSCPHLKSLNLRD
ncbi:hypothetical protein C5167_021685 [Papaver somniferum]|uniref:F-box domain-containing protein n=1 Tax=Papaver somniferum TaxID=3469 RepID=A0A4Y7JGP5_PAPSO|nr:putative F-box/LRR-repeat protein 23 [Papaver somniferum]RZC59927.1 hypothetical protein C5167_021685 [Papaver somniferum]